MSWKKGDWAKLGGGFVLGSIGLVAATSRPARALYKHLAAGVMMSKDYVMETAEKVQAACSDIAEDANEIRDRYHKEADAAFDLGADTDAEFKEVSEEE